MSGKDAFRVEGVVIEVLSERTCRVRLPNGHELLGFGTLRNRRVTGSLTQGQTVTLQLTPFDLSSGRILAAERMDGT
jgi:translation initiation factor IF-1